MAGVVKQFFRRGDPVGKLFSKGDVVRIMPSGEIGGRSEEAWKLVGAAQAVFDPDDVKTPSVPGTLNSALWVQLESKAPYSGLIEVDGYNEADNSVTFKVDDGEGNITSFQKTLPTFGITDNGDGSYNLTDGESGTTPTKIYGGQPVAALDSTSDTYPLAASQGKVLQSNIDSEAQSRADGDSTLQSNIDSEAQSRADGDSTLQSNIDTETQARQAADTAQAALIANLQSSAHPALSVTTGAFSWDAATQELTIPTADSSGGWVNTSDGSAPSDRTTPIETDGPVKVAGQDQVQATLGLDSATAGQFTGNLYQLPHVNNGPIVDEQRTPYTAYGNVRDTDTNEVIFRRTVRVSPTPRYSLSFKWDDGYREGLAWDSDARGLKLPQGIAPSRYANYIYVDPVNGDDAGLGRSKTTPVATLERAAENFVDGAVNTIFLSGDLTADTSVMQYFGGDFSVSIYGRSADFASYVRRTLTLTGSRQWPYAYGRLMAKFSYIDLVSNVTKTYLLGAGGAVDLYMNNSSYTTDGANLVYTAIRCQSYFAGTTLPPGNIFYGYAAGTTNLGRYSDTNLTSA